MNKPQISAPEKSGEANLTNVLAPIQESVERLRQASHRLTATCTEIASEQANFLQGTLFDSLTEMQSLRRVRVPAEFFETSMEFACKQATRSLEAFGEMGSELCNCWFEALKAAPSLASREPRSRSVH